MPYSSFEEHLQPPRGTDQASPIRCQKMVILVAR
jgi:hypothetical protein